MGNRHSVYAKEVKSFTKIETIKRRASSTQIKRKRSSSVPVMLRKRSTMTRACRDVESGQLFSEHEQLLILRSWLRHLEPVKDQFGIRTYQQVFCQAPELIPLFTSDSVDLQEIPYNPRFCLQAIKIVSFIDEVVRMLDNPKEIESRLLNLGRRHVKHRGVGFTPYHWWVFHQCMLIALTEFLPEQQSSYSKADCILAWQKLISYMVETMKRGFDNAVYEQIPCVYDSYALSLEIGRRSRHSSIEQDQTSTSTSPSPNGTLSFHGGTPFAHGSSGGRCPRRSYPRSVQSAKTPRRVTYSNDVSSSNCDEEECPSSGFVNVRRMFFL